MSCAFTHLHTPRASDISVILRGGASTGAPLPESPSTSPAGLLYYRLLREEGKEETQYETFFGPVSMFIFPTVLLFVVTLSLFHAPQDSWLGSR